MTILSKERWKGFLAGIFAATGTWMIILNLREYLLKISPISNQYIIGIVLIALSWYIGKK